MQKSHRKKDRSAQHLIVGLAYLIAIPCSVSLAAPPAAPITSSGLNTTVSAPITLPTGQTQFNITGGTRPGGGVNLFHSFGNLNVPNGNIANFLNNSGLTTSNILGRVTGGNLSNILGTIQTTGFGNANLFLINPAGILFGPNATVNVGGMVTFTSADYLKLADGVRFNATPKASVDSLLSAAPVAAFGFLGSNPGAITVQGSHLSVAEGTGISLVGGNITVQAGTLTAPSGQINLVSVDKPSHAKVGGEVANGSGFVPTGFKGLGDIILTQGSTIDTSVTASSGYTAGVVSIRGGQFVMDASSIRAVADKANTVGQIIPDLTGGNIEVTAKNVNLSNHSTINSSAMLGNKSVAGNITINANSLSASDSTINASACCNVGTTGISRGGAVTVQGFNPGTGAEEVSLSNTNLFAHGQGGTGGAITIRANNILVNHSGFGALSSDDIGQSISLKSTRSLEIHDSGLSAEGSFAPGGTIQLEAGKTIDLSNTGISARSAGNTGGTISLSAPFISISGSTLTVRGDGFSPGGTINLTGRNSVSLTNGTLLNADNTFNFTFPSPNMTLNNGGTILINGGGLFTSQQSTISAQSVLGNGGTLHIEANKVVLTDSQLTTSVSGGPQTVGGHITVDAKKVTLDNSQVLSTATEGHGGVIEITSHNRHPVIDSVIDASSQLGTDGTVTIQRQ